MATETSDTEWREKKQLISNFAESHKYIHFIKNIADDLDIGSKYRVLYFAKIKLLSYKTCYYMER